MLIHRDTETLKWFYKGTKPDIGNLPASVPRSVFFYKAVVTHGTVMGSLKKLKRSKAAYQLHISHTQTIIPGNMDVIPMT